MSRIGVCLLFVGLSCAIVTADITLPSIFSDNMILQCDKPIHIWGFSDEPCDVLVRIRVAGKTVVSGKAKSLNGKWSIDLAAQQASFTPHKLQVVSGSKLIAIENVLFGELWLTAGQSNMQYPLMNAKDGTELIGQADELKGVRVFFQSSANPAPQPLNDVYEGKWSVNSSNTAKWSSAVGYTFVKNLAKRLNVPVGLIHTAQGGTNIQVWLANEILEKAPDLKHNIVDSDYDWSQSDSWQKDSGLFNSKIKPLAGFPIRGIAWYQGENNYRQPEKYKRLFKLLVDDWRRLWGDSELPFIYVQLASYEKEDWSQFRYAQSESLDEISNTAMVVTADLPTDYGTDIEGFYGNPHPIHPATKIPVGNRLTLAALALAYREDVVYNGPVAISAVWNSSKVVAEFKNIGSGLVLRDSDGVSGFELAGSDGSFFPAAAKIIDNKIILTSDKVHNPVKLRYGWAASPIMTLFNEEGLPAGCFVLNCR